MFHGKQVLLAALLAAASPLIGAQAPPKASPVAWTSTPQYVRLFAPTGERAEAYRAYTSSLSLQEVLQRLETDSALLHPPGAWAPVAMLPQDAFGRTGNYQIWKLSRLFGARRAMVARGPRDTGNGAAEAWTLISPYPSPELERLEPGTLLLVLDLTR